MDSDGSCCWRSIGRYAFLGAAPGGRREASWTRTRTRMGAAACARARSSAGSNGDRPRTRTHPPATPSPPFPPVIPSSTSPLHPTPARADSLTPRGMMMGLPVKGHSRDTEGDTRCPLRVSERGTL